MMFGGEGPGLVSRRRVAVFALTLLIAAASSLAFVYSRAPEYRAVARLQISPAASVGDQDDETKSPTLKDDPQAFLTEVQVLTSRPLLGQAVSLLRGKGPLPDLGRDPVDAVQGMLRADPVEGTEIVQLAGFAANPDFASDLVNAVASTYRREVEDKFRTRAAQTYADVSAEANALAEQVATKRKQVDAYRQSSDIVSLERQENGVIASISQLSSTFALSNQKLAAAQGRLKALKEAAADGRSVARAKDDPTLADLEMRASSLREELKDLQRRYTPDYLALDADARALQARVADLDVQLKAQRAASEKAALSEAQDEVSGAGAEVARLQRDLNDNKRAAQDISARLAQFKVLQDDLDHLQTMQRLSQDRLTKLEASERERAPRVEVLEAASPIRTPWRPLYTRDAGIAIAGSLLLAVFAVWLVEYVMGPRPVVAAAIYPAVPGLAPAIERFPVAQALPRSVSAPNLLQIEAPDPLPRELRSDEVAALMANGSDDARLVAAALLTGLTVTDLTALRWDMIGLDSGTIAFDETRRARLESPVAELIRSRTSSSGSATLIHDDHGGPLNEEDIDRLLLFGAYDAGLDRPQEVTAKALRRTYLMFLIRQGLRASELSRLAGAIPHSELVAYLQQVRPGPRLPPEQIARVHPALGAAALT